MASDLPILRLKPKADARRIRWGHPWVFGDDMVLDRRSRALQAGTLCTLEDADRTPLATVAATTSGRIAARVLDGPGVQIDSAWVAARVARADRLRATLFDTPFYRLVHAEGDSLPGVIIDRFGTAAVIQPNAAWAEARLDAFVDALRALGISTIYKAANGRARAAEGLDDVSGLLCGTLDGPIEVVMNGASYFADLEGGQKTGLFYDQRPNHRFVASLAKDARVLDVFSHVGGFALAALAGGAREAMAVDGSAPALELAGQGAAARGLGDRLTVAQGDAFDAMAGLEPRRFDVVIADPPAFAPSKNALTQGLRAYEKVAKLAAGLVAEGGYLTLCSCSHAAELGKFRAACIRGIGRAGRSGQLIRTGFAGPDHPVHPQLAETGYLKALTFRL